MWKKTRINHNFIFEFSPNTALKHRDAFLICTSFMTTVLGAMVIQLVLKSAGFSRDHVDALPAVLLLVIPDSVTINNNAAMKAKKITGSLFLTFNSKANKGAKMDKSLFMHNAIS